jgi:hypothetical protein
VGRVGGGIRLGHLRDGAAGPTHIRARSNCHGPYGSAYGAEFGRRLSDDDLKKVVDEMCVGPANAPVEEGQLKVLVDYHKAMIAKKPFVVVTKASARQDQIVLDGEVLPGSVVEVEKSPAKVTGHLWTVQVPAKAEYEIVAKRGDATTSIRFSR